MKNLYDTVVRSAIFDIVPKCICDFLNGIVLEFNICATISSANLLT